MKNDIAQLRLLQEKLANTADPSTTDARDLLSRMTRISARGCDALAQTADAAVLQVLSTRRTPAQQPDETDKDLAAQTPADMGAAAAARKFFMLRIRQAGICIDALRQLPDNSAETAAAAVTLEQNLQSAALYQARLVAWRKKKAGAQPHRPPSP